MGVRRLGCQASESGMLACSWVGMLRLLAGPPMSVVWRLPCGFRVAAAQSNFKRQPKIPAQLLRDFAPKGALYCIAAKCDDIMAARDLRRIEWANPNKRKEVGGAVGTGGACGPRLAWNTGQRPMGLLYATSA